MFDMACGSFIRAPTLVTSYVYIRYTLHVVRLHRTKCALPVEPVRLSYTLQIVLFPWSLPGRAMLGPAGNLLWKAKPGVRTLPSAS